MRSERIRTLPSKDVAFTPARVLRGISADFVAGKGISGVDATRSQRIQTLPGGFFRIRNGNQRKRLIALQYARVVTSEAKADAFDKKSRYLSAKSRRKQGKLSRVVIKTHNKDYSERITVQDRLRRQNDRQTKKLRWTILRLVKSAKPFSQAETIELVRATGEWAVTAIEFLPGEKFFVSKGQQNVARKLSLKRLEFIRNNIRELERLVNLMRKKRLITDLAAREVFSAVETVYEEGRKYWDLLPNEEKDYTDGWFGKHSV